MFLLFLKLWTGGGGNKYAPKCNYTFYWHPPSMMQLRISHYFGDVIVITGDFNHLLMKCHFCVRTHLYTPKDKSWRVDVMFYHLLTTVAYKQLTTAGSSLSPWTHKYSQYLRWKQNKNKNKKSVSDFYIWKKIKKEY